MVHRLVLPVARGTLPEPVAAALGASTLTGLTKPGSHGKLRPIGVGEAIRRIAARAVVRQLSARLRQHFSPLQYGVETRGGAHQVLLTLRGHVERAIADSEPVLLLRIDAKNAFNCLARKAFFSELRKHFPELLSGICAFYVRDGALHVRGEDGTVHTLCSNSGVTQGDVYGMFLFALGIHPILAATMERFGKHGVYVLAYADDDIHLVGPPAATWRAFCFLRSELKREANLGTSAGKCSAYSPGDDYPHELFLESLPRPDGTPGDIVLMQDGFTVLGIPFHVGRPSYVTSAKLLESFQDAANARSLVSSLHSVVDLATHGAPHGRFAASKLLRICITGKTNYFTQLVNPNDAEAANIWAAEHMSKTWLAIAGGGRHQRTPPKWSPSALGASDSSPSRSAWAARASPRPLRRARWPSWGITTRSCLLATHGLSSAWPSGAAPPPSPSASLARRATPPLLHPSTLRLSPSSPCSVTFAQL